MKRFLRGGSNGKGTRGITRIAALLAGLLAAISSLFASHTIPNPPSQSAAAASAVTRQADDIQPASTPQPTSQTSGIAQNPEQETLSRPAQSSSGPVTPAPQQLTVLDPLTEYATQEGLASATAALAAKFSAEIAALSPLSGNNTAPTPQWVAGGGNYATPLAAAQAINNLSNVTITNANLAASEIPDLSGQYLSLNGGKLTALGTFRSGFLSQASSTVVGNLTVTGALAGGSLSLASASTSALIASNSLTLPTSFTGVLHAVAGVVSAAAVNLASDVTGILPVANGGTGWGNINSGSILFGNGASALVALAPGPEFATSSTNFDIAASGVTNVMLANSSITIGATPIALGTTAGTSANPLQNLYLAGDPGKAAIFNGVSPGYFFNGRFGGWTISMDAANQTAPDSDLAVGSICSGSPLCNNDFDFFYFDNNQDGASSPVVVSGGSGYASNDRITLNTQAASFTGAISGTSMTVASMTSGTITAGEALRGSGVSGNTTILTQLTGTTGGAGTYQVNNSQTVGSEPLTADDCLVRPVLNVTNASGGVIQSGGVSIYPNGGEGRCLVDPSGTLSQSSTTGGGSGATFTVTMKKNWPSISAGGGSAVGQITANFTPYTMTVYANTYDPNFGALNIETSGDTGPAFAVTTTGGTLLDQISMSGALSLVSNGLAVGTSQLVVAGGNVGIGTTSPKSILDLHGNSGDPVATANSGLFNIDVSTGVELAVGGAASAPFGMWMQGKTTANGASLYPLALEPLGGNVAIGTTTPYSRLEVWGPDTASTSAFAVVNNASTTEFAVYDTGNAVLSGGLTQNSDQRLKTNVQSLDASSSLAAIDALNPVSFDWINGIFGGGDQLGFIAQAVQSIFPQLVSTTSPTELTPNGTLGLNYSGLIAPIVAAIQSLAGQLASLENTVAGFAENFVSRQITATNALCVGSTCVTPAQFQAMVAAAGQGSGGIGGAGAATDSSDDSSSTPPILQINGDNPATVSVGATYNDLGATITGPQQDLNLDIATFVNGIAMDPVQIDTSAEATDTIDYVVTDQNGLTSTSTRTVIVEVPQTQGASSTAS